MRLMPNAYTHLMLGIADYNAGSYSAAVDALQTCLRALPAGRARCGSCWKRSSFSAMSMATGRICPTWSATIGWGSGWRKICRMKAPCGRLATTPRRCGSETGRYEEAYAWFSGQEQPTLMALHKLAICCEKTGRREEALRALTRAETMDIDEIDRALALRLLQLVRYRLEHPDYLTHDDYGTLLLDSFDRLQRERRLAMRSFICLGCWNGTRQPGSIKGLRAAGSVFSRKNAVKRISTRILGVTFPNIRAVFSFTALLHCLQR